MIKEAIKHYLEANSFTEFAPRVVLFDMYGVLYNSMHAAGQGYNAGGGATHV